MKHACSILLLLLLASSLCFASSNQITFGNEGGTLTGSNAGLALTGSTLTSVTNIVLPLAIGDLGTVQFSTGALIGGNLQQGGIFAAGGTFTVMSNGSEGLPSGVLFTGTFATPVTWILVTLANGTHSYVMQGVLTGTLFNGEQVNAVEVQLTTNTGKGFMLKSVFLSGGSTVVTQPVTTPEPGSLVFMGTGLLGLGTLVKRRSLFRLAS